MMAESVSVFLIAHRHACLLKGQVDRASTSYLLWPFDCFDSSDMESLMEIRSPIATERLILNK